MNTFYHIRVKMVELNHIKFSVILKIRLIHKLLVNVFISKNHLKRFVNILFNLLLKLNKKRNSV